MKINHTELMIRDAAIGNNYEDFKKMAKKRGWKVFKYEEVFIRNVDYSRIKCKVIDSKITDLIIG